MKTKPRSDRRGRVLRTAAQRQELVREWRAAGITQAEFCVRHGIHPTTFSTWCRAAVPKPLKRDKPRQGVKFAEFKMPAGSVAPIEMELPGGVRIRLHDAGLCRELLPACMQASRSRPLVGGEAAC